MFQPIFSCWNCIALCIQRNSLTPQGGSKVFANRSLSTYLFLSTPGTYVCRVPACVSPGTYVCRVPACVSALINMCTCVCLQLMHWRKWESNDDLSADDNDLRLESQWVSENVIVTIIESFCAKFKVTVRALSWNKGQEPRMYSHSDASATMYMFWQGRVICPLLRGTSSKKSKRAMGHNTHINTTIAGEVN